MKQMTLGKRISLAGCLILITVAVALFYFISQGFSKDISIAVAEQNGNRYLRPLEALLSTVPDHELAARRLLRGDHTAAADLDRLAAQVDAAFERLGHVDHQLGPALEFTPEGLAKRKRERLQASTVRSEWLALKAVSQGGTADQVAASDAAHDQLTADIRGMIGHAGDTSNLILDGDLDSYYLVDVTLATLPQTQDRLASIARLGEDLLAAQNISGKKGRDLAVAAAMLKQADLDHLLGDVDTSLKEDPDFHGTSPSLQKNLPPATEAYRQKNQLLIDLVAKMLDPQATTPVTAYQFQAAAAAARAAAFDLWTVSSEELEVLLERRIDDLASKRLIALTFTAFALLLSFGTATWVVRNATRSLRSMSDRVLGQSQQIAHNLSGLAEASASLASSSSNQASALEETASAGEQIRSMAERNGDNSRSASQLVRDSQSKFEETTRLLNEMVGAMSGIGDGVGQISKIIKIIDGIAFQTNLLALNAAVEAARAGESGLGFGVVAEEVRRLARHCAEAALETETLIEEAMGRVGGGRATVEKMVAAVHMVAGDSVKLKGLIESVSASSSEQSRGVSEVAKAIQQMESMTQANAATALQSASSVVELKANSDQLLEVVEEVAALVGGSTRDATIHYAGPETKRRFTRLDS